MTRRQWLRRSLAGTGCAGAGLAAYARWYEPHWVETVRRDLPIKNLPAALDGLTLMQLSDIHVGPDVSDRYLMAAFQSAQLLNPDFVALTGDFLTYDSGSDWNQFESVYEHVPHGRLATLACLGNHDYGRGFAEPEVADAVTQRLTNAGVRVLRNEAAEISGLTFFGLDDLWGGHWQRSELQEAIPQHGTAIALAHNPDFCDKRIWGAFQGWILSGHTHGGQCRLPFLTPPLLSVRNRRYVAGEIDLYDGRRLYINRALGHLLQMRFLVRPEVTLFTLRPAEPATLPLTDGLRHNARIAARSHRIETGG